MRAPFKTCFPLLLLAGWLHLPVGAAAQDPFADNPFGEAPATAAEPAATVPAAGPGEAAPVALAPLDDSLDKPTRLILETLRASDPTEPGPLCAAIRTLLDLDRGHDARFYLDRLIGQSGDPASLVALMDREGSDFFLRLHGDERLAPEGQVFAKAVFAAARDSAESPEALAAAIERLADDRLEVRSDAFARLRRTGAPAMAALIGSFASESDPRKVTRMRSALRQMGSEALLPLLAGLQAEPLQVRYECANALARLKDPDALYAAAHAAFSPAEHQQVRDAVRAGINETWGGLPDFPGLVERMRVRTSDLLAGRSLLPFAAGTAADHSTTTGWKWNDEAGRLEAETVSPLALARRVARDRAADLMSLVPADPRFRSLFLIAWLESAKLDAGPLTPLDPAMVDPRLAPLHPPELDQAIRLALDHQLYPAAAAACDLLGQIPEAADLLTGTATSGLIRAVQSGDRNTSFAAVRAVLALDPGRGFNGSSTVLESLLMMAGYGERPSVLVAHRSLAEGRNLAVAMSASGVGGRTVTTGRELFAEAVLDANIALLLISEEIQNPPCADLLQQIRNDWRTRRMPVAILTESEDYRRARRIAEGDALTLVLPRTDNRQQLQLQLQQLDALRQPWKVAPDEGLEQGDWAVATLARIAAEPDRFPHYSLVAHDKRLAGLLPEGRLTLPMTGILAGIGTRDAQRALVEYASGNGWPVELRTAAAQAFGKSMSVHGLLLTTAEIRQQFDRYNASQNEPPESQRVLGSLLDMIEIRSGRAAATEAATGGE